MAQSKLNNTWEGICGASAIAFALLTPFLRFQRVKWGATKAELKRSLPGDELMPHAKWQYTNAITIDASVADVWKWLVQMGQGRGGFYSYQSLENMVGCDIHNAVCILPQFQTLNVGEEIKLHPQGPGYPVAIVERERVIVLYADTRSGNSPVPISNKPGNYFASIWIFFIEKIDAQKTRFITRFKSDYSKGFKNSIFYGTCLVEPVSTVMQKKMLKGIKQWAESMSGMQYA
jgi:hypothetical protein